MNKHIFVLFVFAVVQLVRGQIQISCQNTQTALEANITCVTAIANYDGDIIRDATCGSLLAEVENVCRNIVSSNVVVRQ